MKEELLYKIQNEELTKEIIEFYVNDYGTTNLINSLSCSKERKKDIYRIVLEIYPYDYNLFTKLSNEEDKYTFYELIADEKEVYPYKLFSKLKDPKKYLDKKYISDIVSNTPNNVLVNDFKAYFKDEIMEYSKGFELLKVKELLDNETIIKLFKRVDNFDDYKKICSYLELSELKDFCKIYILSNKKDVNISYDLIFHRLYNDDSELKYLIDVICNNAPANIIYSLLVSTSLEEKYKEKLEKALIKTNDKEYLTYYYFYKDREKFILLYGSVIAFLAFVSLNESMFKNKVLLNDVIDTLRKENREFSNEIKKGITKVLTKK